MKVKVNKYVSFACRFFLFTIMTMKFSVSDIKDESVMNNESYNEEVVHNHFTNDEGMHVTNDEGMQTIC